MKLRSSRILRKEKNQLSERIEEDENRPATSASNRKEMRNQVENEDDDTTAEEMVKRSEVVRIGQLINLVKEVNAKLNKQMKEVKRDVQQEVGVLREELRVMNDSWE